MAKPEDKAVSGGTEPVIVRGMVHVPKELSVLQKRLALVSGPMLKFSILVYWNAMVLAAFGGMTLPGSVAFGAHAAIGTAALFLIGGLAFGDEAEYKEYKEKT